MKDNAAMTLTMPFGKYRGRLVVACDTPYLDWFAREVRNAKPELLDAIRAELARRRVAAQRQPPTAPRTGYHAADVNQQAVMALLNDLVAAGARVVARGEGCVHCSGATLTPELRRRLQRLHTDIDRLARHVRWKAHGCTRTTLASVLLAGLAVQDFYAKARPAGKLAWTPQAPCHQPLVAALQQVAGEIWFRRAVRNRQEIT